MQIDKLFTAIWHNTTTGPGTPLTGLSATITIRDKSTNTIVVNDEAMIEIGLGEYDYTFNAMDPNKPYSYVMSPNSASAYVVSGFVDPRIAFIDKSLSDIAVGGGGGSINLSGVTGSINNLSKLVKDESEKTRQLITDENNETNSHIDIAKTEVINTIDGIYLPEVDTTDIIKGIGIIKAQNTKLANYLKGEEDKEKSEMMKIHKKTMDDMEKAYAEMEKAYAEMEKAYAEMEKENEKEKDDIMSSADEIIAVLEDENKTIGEDILEKIKIIIK